MATDVRPVNVPADSSPTAITTRVGAATSASTVGAIAGDRRRNGRRAAGRHGSRRLAVGIPNWAGSGNGSSEVFVGELSVPRRHGDERRHSGTPSLGRVCVAKLGHRALGGFRVGKHGHEGRLMGHQNGDIVGVCRHERERGDRTTTAREHLDRAGVESPDDGVHIACLDGGCVVDPTVFADAAAEAARVIGDHGAVGEVRRQRAEAAGVHRLPDHEQRGASVGGGQRALDVVDDVGLAGIEGVRIHVHVWVSPRGAARACRAARTSPAQHRPTLRRAASARSRTGAW